MSIETPKQAPSNVDTNPEQAAPATMTAEELRDAVHPNRKKSLFEKLDARQKQMLVFGAIAGGVGVLGVGGAVVAGSLGAEHSPSDDKQPNATGPTIAGQEVTNQPTPEAHPSVSPTNLGPLETTAPTQEVDPSAQYELKAGQTPEALIHNVTDVFTQWNMAGANKETTDEIFQYVMTNGNTHLAEHLKELAKKDTPVFKKALFGETPAAGTAKAVNDYEAIETFITEMYMKTSKDPEPYKTWNTVESVQLLTQTDTTRQIQVQYTEHDNAATGVNNALKYMGEHGNFEGQKRTVIFDFKTVGDKEIITSIQ